MWKIISSIRFWMTKILDYCLLKCWNENVQKPTCQLDPLTDSSDRSSFPGSTPAYNKRLQGWGSTTQHTGRPIIKINQKKGTTFVWIIGADQLATLGTQSQIFYWRCCKQQQLDTGKEGWGTSTFKGSYTLTYTRTTIQYSCTFSNVARCTHIGTSIPESCSSKG